MYKIIICTTALLLGGCMYADTPYGRVAAVDLPVHSSTTSTPSSRARSSAATARMPLSTEMRSFTPRAAASSSHACDLPASRS